MSDDKPKPFAEVVEHHLGWAIHADGRALGLPWSNSVTPRQITEQLNAAVEAREAKLHQAIGYTLGHLSGIMHLAVSTPGCVDIAEMANEAAERLDEAIGHEPSPYVPGDVACALAFDLGVARAHLEGPMMVLLDLLLENPRTLADQHFPLIYTRLGLGSLLDPAGIATDDQLRAECRRRGWPMPRFVARVESVAVPPVLNELHSRVDAGAAVLYVSRSTYDWLRREAERAAANSTLDLPQGGPLRFRGVPVEIERADRASLPNLPSELRPGEVFGDWGATMARDPQDDVACRSCVGRNGHHEVGCPRVRGVAPARTSP